MCGAAAPCEVLTRQKSYAKRLAEHMQSWELHIAAVWDYRRRLISSSVGHSVISGHDLARACIITRGLCFDRADSQKHCITVFLQTLLHMNAAKVADTRVNISVDCDSSIKEGHPFPSKYL